MMIERALGCWKSPIPLPQTAIRHAIASGQASNAEEIGVALRAGTNCGSCLPELKRIVADAKATANV